MLPAIYCLAFRVKISADDILKYFFLFFPEKKALKIHANCLFGDYSHIMLQPIF